MQLATARRAKGVIALPENRPHDELEAFRAHLTDREQAQVIDLPPGAVRVPIRTYAGRDRALGYTGDRRFVAWWYDRESGVLTWDDGRERAVADAAGARTFVERAELPEWC